MIVNTKTYEQLPFCEKEILRYAECMSADDETLSLMHTCIDEVKSALSYKVCWCELDVKVCGSVCDFGIFNTNSQDLAKFLKDESRITLFGATIGIDIDRLITKYGRISPARALMLQAIGAEQIENLCDTFCEEFRLNVRFSPGYGDLPLPVQKDIFNTLSCQKRIGLYLSDSMVMSPSKSVTAFAKAGIKTSSKCTQCAKNDCIFRGGI
jgi:hypothetical protein